MASPHRPAAQATVARPSDHPGPEQLRPEQLRPEQPRAEQQRGGHPRGAHLRGDQLRGDQPRAEQPRAEQQRGDRLRGDQLRADQPRGDQLGAVSPPPDGITLLGRLRRAHPGLRVVVLAAADDPRRAARALHAGATGWVAKESSLARLLAVVRGVLRDETHVPPALLTGVIRELTTARRDRTESERLVDALTPREKQILRCMVAGLGRQAVAERLYLSPHTVRTHMQNVLGKLGVHSTLAAVAVARRAGISPAEPAPPPSVASTS
ncbi:LuxR C-terminal-related transcriptional regulator [Kitasatospora sp. NPDC048194]|uniref:LuxR C-terminal-related transcriptional regulator n=1 Tax=Kitasatospora sp. NPDC048194 TaxID=3364045 RepID=UPI00371770B8